MERIDRLKAMIETAEEKKIEINSDSWMKKGFEKKQECDFFCLCGSHEYKTHWNSNGVYGPGYCGWVTYYECSECSNIFGQTFRICLTQPRLRNFPDTGFMEHPLNFEFPLTQMGFNVKPL